MPKIKSANFEVRGTMRVKGRPKYDVNGEICGYIQKDGSIVKLVVAIEVQNKAGTKFRYLYADKDMRALGFELEGYDKADFIEL
jgi:hypothetical protein